MDFYPLPENAARQAIDSSTVFYELRRALAEASAYRGGMYWKSQGVYEYLVKTAPDNRQSRLGPRTVETESLYATFTSNKKNANARVKSLRGAVREAERLNKALRVGRVPPLVVSILQVFDQAGLAHDLAVVDTHALFVYETAAAVRITTIAPVAREAGLLWDATKRVSFMASSNRLDTSILRVLQRADHSFRLKGDRDETATNDKGFKVVFLDGHREGEEHWSVLPGDANTRP